MYSYGGSLYKKNGSLKSQLNRKPQQKLPLTEETCLAGLKILKNDDDDKGVIPLKVIEISTGLWTVELENRKFNITLTNDKLYKVEELLYPRWEYKYIGTVISFNIAKMVITSFCHPNWLGRLV